MTKVKEKISVTGLLFWLWTFALWSLGDYDTCRPFVPELRQIPEGAIEVTIVFLFIGVLVWLKK